jgi:uncharacterized membrane protein YeaQ/YmgE (transglycosylase-associated protein family)
MLWTIRPTSLTAHLKPADCYGIIVTILLGVAGALVGRFLSVALGVDNGVDDFDIGTIFLSEAGAMLLLGGYRPVTRAA